MATSSTVVVLLPCGCGRRFQRNAAHRAGGVRRASLIRSVAPAEVIRRGLVAAAIVVSAVLAARPVDALELAGGRDDPRCDRGERAGPTPGRPPRGTNNEASAAAR
jgi:hypothetical protein